MTPRQVIRIEGRPDLDMARRGEGCDFGVTHLKRHPKYVYSHRGALVHRIIQVDVHWWRGCYDHMERLDQPTVIAQCACGQSLFLNRERKNGGATMCEIPREDAILCGRCNGTGPVFGRNRKTKNVTWKEAHDRLGCVVISQ